MLSCVYLKVNGYILRKHDDVISIFSSPEQSSGRAIALPPALELVSASGLAKH